MKDSAYKISLDINGSGSQLVLNARHMDTGRKLYVSLRSGGEPYIIEKNCYAAFAATKPDGTALYNACEIEGNEIVYEFTEQTCSVIGRSRCEIILYGPDDKVITSPRFALLVDGTICPEGKVVSTDEFTALTHATSEAIEATGAANDAATKANTAATDALSAAQRASDATVDAEDATTRADNAAQEANTATGAANQAATAATQAAQSANTAAGDARYAADGADGAAASANQAAQAANSASINANQAATKAANTAKSLMVVGKAEGANIYLDDAIDQFLVGCRIFGKTTQDGVPTPDAPVELVSVGDSGSIAVNVIGDHDAQSMTVATPNGLPGIKVASGGNYTDANGQQWVCDEIDLARGVYAQRVGNIATENLQNALFILNNSDGSNTFYQYIVHGAISKPAPGSSSTIDPLKALCNAFPLGRQVYQGTVENNFWIYQGESLAFVLNKTTCPDAESAREYVLSHRPVIYYILKNPIETPLSEEELAAYAALHTYRGNTTVSNDASAHMEIEYVMDAKKYIDSLVTGTGTGTIVPATVE